MRASLSGLGRGWFHCVLAPLRTWLEAPEFLIDAEAHRADDSSDAKRWFQGDNYDAAVGRIQMSTGSLLEVLVHVRKPTGASASPRALSTPPTTTRSSPRSSRALICRFARGDMGQSGSGSTGRAAA